MRSRRSVIIPKIERLSSSRVATLFFLEGCQVGTQIPRKGRNLALRKSAREGRDFVTVRKQHTILSPVSRPGPTGHIIAMGLRSSNLHPQ